MCVQCRGEFNTDLELSLTVIGCCRLLCFSFCSSSPLQVHNATFHFLFFARLYSCGFNSTLLLSIFFLQNLKVVVVVVVDVSAVWETDGAATRRRENLIAVQRGPSYSNHSEVLPLFGHWDEYRSLNRVGKGKFRCASTSRRFTADPEQYQFFS